MRTTTKETINQVLAMLAFRCPGRDPLSEIAKANPRSPENAQESLSLFWFDELKDLDADCLIHATRDLCGAPGQWSPSVGDIRQRAVELSLGHLAPPSPGDAWERVCDWAKGEPIQLSEDEKAAVKRTGGKWELKHGENVTTTRAHFLRFYDELVKKRVMTKRAHPETKAIANLNAPALPAAPAGRLTIPEHRASDPETVSSLLDGLKGYRDEHPRPEEI